jgi:hypothetical protein
MKRWAIEVIDRIDGKKRWVSIGKGLSDYAQDAHLHSHQDLAEKKMKYYPVGPHDYHYVSARIVEVEVTGL